MAGLSDLLADKETKTTTLPDWYTSAAQQSLQGAQQAFSQTPQAQNTVGQLAVNQFAGAQNPFTQGQDILTQVGQGAANPWMTTDSGEVVPDTSTNLGGLFQSQRDYLEQMLPGMTSRADAGAIGSGNFGSLRGLTARNQVVSDAIAKMNADQYTAANQANTQAIQAGSALSNLGGAYGDQALKLAQFQQASPFSGVLAYNKALSGLTVPTTVTDTTQYSPLGQATAIGKFFGTPAAQELGKQLGLTGTTAGSLTSDFISKLISGGKNLIGGGGGGLPEPSTEGWYNNGGLYTQPGEEYNPGSGGDELVELGGGGYDFGYDVPYDYNYEGFDI